MKNNKLKSKKRKYDTFSITMELERPLIEEAENKENKKTKRKLKKKVVVMAILILLLSLGLGFFIWLSNSYIPTSEAKLYLNSDSTVEVSTDKNRTIFTPKNYNPSKGIIFYPEAKVEARAYSKLCKMIANYGYEVVAVDMPFNYATFGKNEAKKIINEYTNIDSWVIAGDSLGGITATKYVQSNLEKIDGVILISSYPTDSYLRDINMNVLSIWGSKDGVIKYQSLLDAKANLPEKTSFVEIEGANHSQFADYGVYKNDQEPLISSDDQKEKTVESIVQFLKNI